MHLSDNQTKRHQEQLDELTALAIRIFLEFAEHDLEILTYLGGTLRR
jgi:hypothetical protein